MKDDVSSAVKSRRLREIIDLQNRHSMERNRLDVDKVHTVLVEGPSKRSNRFLQGRNTANKVVIFPDGKCVNGNYVKVLVKDCTSATLSGEVIEILNVH